MSCIRTTTVETDEQKREARGLRLDGQFTWLQAFVCEHGPLLLTRGMEVEEANEAIIACLTTQKKEIARLWELLAVHDRCRVCDTETAQFCSTCAARRC